MIILLNNKLILID